MPSAVPFRGLCPASHRFQRDCPPWPPFHAILGVKPRVAGCVANLRGAPSICFTRPVDAGSPSIAGKARVPHERDENGSQNDGETSRIAEALVHMKSRRTALSGIMRVPIHSPQSQTRRKFPHSTKPSSPNLRLRTSAPTKSRIDGSTDRRCRRRKWGTT